MALPSSGPLTLTDIQTEFGGSNPIGLNEYYAGGANVPAGTSGTYGAVPSSGTIGIRNFYGTQKVTNKSFASWDTAFPTTQVLVQVNPARTRKIYTTYTKNTLIFTDMYNNILWTKTMTVPVFPVTATMSSQGVFALTNSQIYVYFSGTYNGANGVLYFVYDYNGNLVNGSTYYRGPFSPIMGAVGPNRAQLAFPNYISSTSATGIMTTLTSGVPTSASSCAPLSGGGNGIYRTPPACINDYADDTLKYNIYNMSSNSSPYGANQRWGFYKINPDTNQVISQSWTDCLNVYGSNQSSYGSLLTVARWNVDGSISVVARNSSTGTRGGAYYFSADRTYSYLYYRTATVTVSGGYIYPSGCAMWQTSANNGNVTTLMPGDYTKTATVKGYVSGTADLFVGALSYTGPATNYLSGHTTTATQNIYAMEGSDTGNNLLTTQTFNGQTYSVTTGSSLFNAYQANTVYSSPPTVFYVPVIAPYSGTGLTAETFVTAPTLYDSSTTISFAPIPNP